MPESELISRVEFPVEEFVAISAGTFLSSVGNDEMRTEVVVLDMVLAEIGDQAVFEDVRVQVAFDKAGFAAVFTEALSKLADQAHAGDLL